jgi:hypothetical protein
MASLMMNKLKSANHHWWPECVSAHWAAEDGKTGWLRPDGSSLRLPPKHLGVIGNAHHIKLASNSGETSDFDSCFESEYDIADRSFPQVISWLRSLSSWYYPDCHLPARFISQDCADDQLALLTECVVSLAVRGPMNREASVSIVERLRGPVPSPEREALIGCNIRSSQRLISDTIGTNAKFSILFSHKKEFIFGDGFFHNVCGVVNRPRAVKILAPITPEVSVIICRPCQFSNEPRLSTIVLSDQEVDLCNHAVQVYSRQALYFRSEQPEVNEAFAKNEHLAYSHPENPIDVLIRQIPGIYHV